MFRGVAVALVTPFTESREVCQPDAARLVASVRDHVAALVPALSTGEGWALSDRQWQSMVAATVRHAGGLPVLAGIERPTTSQVGERARWAQQLGAAAVVVTTPYGRSVTQEEMYRHYEVLSAGRGLPLVVYNECAVSGNTIELDTLLRICRLPGVAGVKDSSASVEFIRELVAARPGVPVFQGMEHLLMDSGPIDGYVVALANVEAALCVALFTNPGSVRAAQLADVGERYGLARPDWYRVLKAELHGRGVLTTDRTVADWSGTG